MPAAGPGRDSFGFLVKAPNNLRDLGVSPWLASLEELSAFKLEVMEGRRADIRDDDFDGEDSAELFAELVCSLDVCRLNLLAESGVGGVGKGFSFASSASIRLDDLDCEDTDDGVGSLEAARGFEGLCSVGGVVCIFRFGLLLPAPPVLGPTLHSKFGSVAPLMEGIGGGERGSKKESLLVTS